MEAKLSMDFIEITPEKLQVEPISELVTDECTGATSIFVGTTRYFKKPNKKVFIYFNLV